jgi:hypothetical protein
MLKHARIWFYFTSAFALSASAARAEIQVNPEALTHYSHCVSEAKDRNGVYLLDRSVLYRCGSDTSVSYFNYLTRMRVPDYIVSDVAGVFVYRNISGVGKCWHMIQDSWGSPVSFYGCDIYVEY